MTATVRKSLALLVCLLATTGVGGAMLFGNGVYVAVAMGAVAVVGLWCLWRGAARKRLTRSAVPDGLTFGTKLSRLSMRLRDPEWRRVTARSCLLAERWASRRCSP